MPYYHYEETYIKNDQGIDELDKYPTPKKALNPPCMRSVTAQTRVVASLCVAFKTNIAIRRGAALARCEKVRDNGAPPPCGPRAQK